MLQHSEKIKVVAIHELSGMTGELRDCELVYEKSILAFMDKCIPVLLPILSVYLSCSEKSTGRYD